MPQPNIPFSIYIMRGIIIALVFIYSAESKGDIIMPQPNITQTIQGMRELLDEMERINSVLVRKVSDIPNFGSLSRRKIEICDQLIGEHLQPHISQRNKFIQAHPGIRMADDSAPLLKSLVASEKHNTKAALDDPSFTIPGPFLTAVVVPGKSNAQRRQEAIAMEEKQINQANKLFGGKVLLKRGDYLERTQTRQQAAPDKPSKKSFAEAVLSKLGGKGGDSHSL